MKANTNMIGLLGGLGSQASSAIYKKALDLCNGKRDSDFPDLLVYNMPTDAIDVYAAKSERLLKDIDQGVSVLLRAGCTEIIIACNSIYTMLDKDYMARHKIVDVLSLFSKQLSKPEQYITLASSRTTKFQDYWRSKNEYASDISNIIDDVIRGEFEQATEKLEDFINGYNDEKIIIACTELSAIFFPIADSYPNIKDTGLFMAKYIANTTKMNKIIAHKFAYRGSSAGIEQPLFI